jgi:hypothetical protein
MAANKGLDMRLVILAIFAQQAFRAKIQTRRQLHYQPVAESSMSEVAVRKPLGAIDPNIGSPRSGTPKKGSKIVAAQDATPKKIQTVPVVQSEVTPVRKGSDITPRKKANNVPIAKAMYVHPLVCGSIQFLTCMICSVKETPKPYHSPTDNLVSPATRAVNSRFHRAAAPRQSRRVPKAQK